MHLASLSTPHFATSYTLGTVGVIDGSVSYLFSTVPIDNTPSKSTSIPLKKFVPGYCQVQAPLEQRRTYDYYQDGKPTLLYSTLRLPPPTTLNALFLRRISPTVQWSLAVCSNRGPPLSKSAPQASILTQISHDTGKYSNEYLFSTDNALLGWRGLWNFASNPVKDSSSSGGGGGGGGEASSSLLPSLLSAGAEAYYSPLTSLVGMSTGLRFSTLPSPSGPPASSFPYTLTLTLTPLTGSLSTTYSVCASRNLAFSSRFSFNVYSWESEIVAGCELWRQSRRRDCDEDDDDGLGWARRKKRATSGDIVAPSPPLLPAVSPEAPKGEERDDCNESVIKLRVDQSWNVRLLWEGRVKELLVSAGVGLGPRSFSSLASNSAPASSASSQSAGGGGSGGATSYWRGVGVSVLYSS